MGKKCVGGGVGGHHGSQAGICLFFLFPLPFFFLDGWGGRREVGARRGCLRAGVRGLRVKPFFSLKWGRRGSELYITS